MPTYEYECSSCGHTFNKFQSMTEPALKECPECGSSIRRLIGPGVGVIFKGSGFYQTDYKTCPSGGCPEKGAQKKTGTCSSGDKCSCDE